MAQDEKMPLSSSSSSSSGLGRIFFCFISCFNCVATGILATAVVFLYQQLQVVEEQVAQEQAQISHMYTQVTNQTQGQIEQLNVKVEKEHDLTILHMAGTFTLLTGLLTMFHMTMHLRNFHEPFVQRKILAILWMSPIYGFTSFLSLVWPVVEGYLSIIKDFYEAYVIYQFLSFLIAVLGRGDRAVVVDILARHADHLDPPAKCLNRCYHPLPTESDHAKANAVLLECQMLAMQFVFFRPLMSIASFVVTTLNEVEGTDDDGGDIDATSKWAYFTSPLFYIAMIQNVSVFFAFSGMLKFYHAVREDLLWCQPFSKFLVIKGVVFMTFWQGLAISIIVNLHEGGEWTEEDGDSSISPREKAAALQNILICLEMLFFSIAHWCVFPTEEWEEGYRPQEYAKPGIGLKDFVSDMSVIMKSRKASRLSRRNYDKASPDASTEDEEIGEVPVAALQAQVQ